MANNFEKELENELQQDTVIPDVVRNSLDDTYRMIRKKKRSRNILFLKRGVAAAVCSIVLVGTLVSNETVRAFVKPFFNFGDKGIERVVDEGMMQQNNDSAKDQDIRVALDNYFYDSNKLGMSFKLNFDNQKTLKGDIASVQLEYRIKNNNDAYIIESVSDTKPLKGTNNIISSLSHKNPVLDLENGDIRYDVILESSKGMIPKIENATVEIESVVILFKENGENAKIINGSWNLAIDTSKQAEIKEVEYSAVSNTSQVQILSAKASPTSFNLSFSLDVTSENSTSLEILEMKLIGEKGEVYDSSTYSIEINDGKTIISTNFPVSSLENHDKYKLSLSKMGRFEGNEFNTLIPDTEIELVKK